MSRADYVAELLRIADFAGRWKAAPFCLGADGRKIEAELRDLAAKIEHDDRVIQITRARRKKARARR